MLNTWLVQEEPREPRNMQIGILASSVVLHSISCLFAKYQRYLCLNKCLPLQHPLLLADKSSYWIGGTFRGNRLWCQKHRAKQLDLVGATVGKTQLWGWWQGRAAVSQKEPQQSVCLMLSLKGPWLEKVGSKWSWVRGREFCFQDKIFKEETRWWRRFAEDHSQMAGALPQSVALMFCRCLLRCWRELQRHAVSLKDTKTRDLGDEQSLLPHLVMGTLAVSLFSRKEHLEGTHRDLDFEDAPGGRG